MPGGVSLNLVRDLGMIRLFDPLPGCGLDAAGVWPNRRRPVIGSSYALRCVGRGGGRWTRWLGDCWRPDCVAISAISGAVVVGTPPGCAVLNDFEGYIEGALRSGHRVSRTFRKTRHGWSFEGVRRRRQHPHAKPGSNAVREACGSTRWAAS